jgi:NTE family protein
MRVAVAVQAIVACLAMLAMGAPPTRAQQPPSGSATRASERAQPADVLGPLSARASADGVVTRPRIGLVLSGGGARGAAHIGVLKVLEDLGVPIDAIAGTSMGAVIGGLYASGLDARQIESIMESVDWQDSFRDTPPRSDRSFRRKLEDQTFLVRLPLGLRSGDFRIPRGLLQGQKLTQLLRTLTLPVSGIRDFSALPTRFAAVATDLETGAQVRLVDGDLVAAMRASVSAPGVFAPVELDGRLLVDGGLVGNLPVDAARDMGVDVLIAVDVGFPLQERSRLNSVASVSNQMLAILIRRGSDAQRASLGQEDVLVEPKLGDASSFDFSRVTSSIELGETAARARLAELSRWSVPRADYSAWQARRSDARRPAGRIESVTVARSSERHAIALLNEFQRQRGRLADADALERSVSRLYGQGNFELVDYQLVPRAEGGTALELEARRNSWGPNYVRFGLNLQDDFEGNSSFNAAARFLFTELSPRGAEWVWDLGGGDPPCAATEVYLPLDDTARWYLMPAASFELRNVPLRVQGRSIAEFRLRTFDYGIDLGRQFDNWGEWRSGVRRISADSRLRLGDPALTGSSFDVDLFFSRLSFDALDDVNFPREGQVLTAEWRGERSRGSGPEDNDVVTLDALLARSVGRHTGVIWVSGGAHVGGGPPNLRTLLPLGGFLNLSGLAPDSVAGERFAIGRGLYFRKIGRGGEGFLNVPTYIGASVEIGNVWNPGEPMTFRSTRKQGSVFLGLDTLLGPVYLGAGLGDEGESAYYLFLGRTF